MEEEPLVDPLLVSDSDSIVFWCCEIALSSVPHLLVRRNERVSSDHPSGMPFQNQRADAPMGFVGVPVTLAAQLSVGVESLTFLAAIESVVDSEPTPNKALIRTTYSGSVGFWGFIHGGRIARRSA